MLALLNSNCLHIWKKKECAMPLFMLHAFPIHVCGVDFFFFFIVGL